MIVVTDGQLLESSSEATVVDYLNVLNTYEQMGFRHLYFVSLKSHPAQLNPLLGRNPSWRAYTWDQTRAGLGSIFAQIARDIDTTARGRSVVATEVTRQPVVHWFLPALLLLPLGAGLRLHRRLRQFP